MKRRTIEDPERREVLWDKGSAIGGFKPLEEDTHFTDVTLACGDGQVCLAILTNFSLSPVSSTNFSLSPI